jgi:hypothetical protein
LSLRAQRGNLLAMHNRYALAPMHNDEDRRDAILCVSNYAGRFASAELHAGDAKYCVSTKFLHLAPPSLKTKLSFLDSFKDKISNLVS